MRLLIQITEINLIALSCAVALGGSFLSTSTASAEPGAAFQDVDQSAQVDGADGADGADGVDEDYFDLQVQLDSFHSVWQTIADSHWDEKLIQAKWVPLKGPYLNRIEQAKSQDEVRKILRQMIAELKLSPYSIIDSSAYKSIKGSEESGDGTAGMEFRSTDDGVVVSQVRPQSPAAQAGVEPGWILKKIGKQDLDELAAKIEEAARGPIRFETMVGLTLAELASGTKGMPRKFLFVDRDDNERELELDFAENPGDVVKFGNLPAMKIESIAKTLPGGIGYYWFNAFFNPVKLMPEFRQVIRDPNHSNGMIIDLRGNIGGIGGMTMGMASEFSNQQTALGVMNMRGTELKFFVNANIDPVTSPLAVLVDECSISSAEILSGGLQDLKLARVFGNRTAGLALPSVITKLPNGDGFQYAMANYLSASGKSLELDGVMPDELIPLTRTALLADPDPVLTRAMQWIQQQNENQSASN